MNGNSKHQTVRDVLGPHLPAVVIESWESEGVTTLLPIQLKAIEAGCLEGSSCLVVAPTTSGKTFVGEIVCLTQILAMHRTIYLVPFKALAEEKLMDFQRKYSKPEVGARILLSTADRRTQDRQLSEGDFNLAILTYEKLSALLVAHPEILSGAGALVVDEIQLISDETRGAELEILLTRAKQIAPNLQVVGLSAVASNLNGLDTWLGMKLVADDHRPVRLREGVITPDGNFQFVEWIASDRAPGREKLAPLAGDTEDDLAVSLIGNLLQAVETQVLAFVNTVNKTEQIAARVAGSLSLPKPAKRTKQTISGMEETETAQALMSALDHSVAFHNADLTVEERLAVETGFRSGEIRCLVSTSTLSMGVNLPASAVVIVDHQKWTRLSGQWAQTDISVAEYRNMSGRAGRFGIRNDALARSFLVSRSPLEAQALLNKFVHGTPAALESALLKQPLEVRLLRILKICAASGLRIDTFSDLVSLVSNNGASPLDIATVAARGEDTGTNAVSLRLSTPEYNQRTPSLFRELLHLCDSITSPLMRTFLDSISGLLPDYETAKAVKYQAVAAAFVQGVPTRNIETQLGASAAKTRTIGSMCSWLCDTATNIAWSNRNEEQAKTFERLAERFLHGCSDEALVLAQIPYRIHRGEREALIKAGFTTVQSLMDASSEDVARTAKVSRARVQGLQTKIVEVLGATLDLHRAQAVRLKASGHDTGLLEALYVTKGRILEQAIADALALCCSLKIARIGAQNEGEADLQILLRNGHNGIAQVTAKDNPSDRVGLVKACSVLQQSPELHPEIFICFGPSDRRRSRAEHWTRADLPVERTNTSSYGSMNAGCHGSLVTAAGITCQEGPGAASASWEFHPFLA